ncbi:MAG: spondin domain-containing protein [Myxococcota bacterium]
MTIENMAPSFGTFLTPVWVGFHEGRFDTYDGNQPASNDPRPGSLAMERLCEDGNNGPISEDFAALSQGLDATIAGPNGPLAPGEVVSSAFLLDANSPDQRYFSYASMILPSNDFCISNGNPQRHLIFDDNGQFVAQDFFVAGSEVLDAGTEVNDEVPANTAFFGQATPDTGVDENGTIGTLGGDRPAIGFRAKGTGSVLDDPRFRMADFLLPGYPVTKISFAAAPAVVANFDFAARLGGQARGFGHYNLREKGTVLKFDHVYTRLRGVTGATLNLVDTGAVVARLLPEDLSKLSRQARRNLRFYLSGELRADALTGPMAGQPLDALSQALKDGRVEVRIQTRSDAEAVRGLISLR